MATKTLPKNLDAEKSFLALLFLFRNECKSAAEALSPEDFFDQGHGILFKMLKDAVMKGDALDYVLMKQKLEEEESFDKVGGKSGLTAIFGSKLIKSTLPEEASKKAMEYAQIIHDLSMKRRLISFSNDCSSSAYDPTKKPSDIIDDFEERIKRLSKSLSDGNGTEHGGVVFRRVLAQLKEFDDSKGELTGLSTGFRDVDSVLMGIQPTDLVIIAARPAMGKTAFAANIASHAAFDMNIPVLVFSLEMSSEQIIFRMVSSLKKIDSKKMTLGECDEAEWERIIESQDEFDAHPLYINDKSSLTIGEVRRIAREEKERHGIGLIVLDYIQLMEGGASKKDGRTQEVSEISRGLKGLAKELEVPVIALSQLSRAVESRTNKRPMLSDLRESGSIEQDADIVMFLYREAYYEKDRDGVTEEEMDEVRSKAQVIISKNRRGEVADVNMSFIGSYTQFMDLPEPSVVK